MSQSQSEELLWLDGVERLSTHELVSFLSFRRTSEHIIYLSLLCVFGKSIHHKIYATETIFC